jgi:hypothetical protein
MSLDLRSREQSRREYVTAFGFRARVRYLVIAAIATIAARRMLARVIRPYKSRGSPNIPRHILRDIGLPADYFDRPRTFWDHQ